LRRSAAFPSLEVRAELLRRLARPDALREKVMARIEALPTYVWDNTDDDDTEYVSLASVNSAVAAVLEADHAE
jgi:hypothetical protein